MMRRGCRSSTTARSRRYERATGKGQNAPPPLPYAASPAPDCLQRPRSLARSDRWTRHRRAGDSRRRRYFLYHGGQRRANDDVHPPPSAGARAHLLSRRDRTAHRPRATGSHHRHRRPLWYRAARLRRGVCGAADSRSALCTEPRGGRSAPPRPPHRVVAPLHPGGAGRRVRLYRPRRRRVHRPRHGAQGTSDAGGDGLSVHRRYGAYLRRGGSCGGIYEWSKGACRCRRDADTGTRAAIYRHDFAGTRQQSLQHVWSCLHH